MSIARKIALDLNKPHGAGGARFVCDRALDEWGNARRPPMTSASMRRRQ